MRVTDMASASILKAKQHRQSPLTLLDDFTIQLEHILGPNVLSPVLLERSQAYPEVHQALEYRQLALIDWHGFVGLSFTYKVTAGVLQFCTSKGLFKH